MFEQLTPAEFLRCRSAGELWQLLDVREPWELEIARLDQSIDIPMAEIASRHAELDPGRPVAVVCHSGARSARVAGFLVQQGFSRVANIEGGIDAWSRETDRTLPRY